MWETNAWHGGSIHWCTLVVVVGAIIFVLFDLFCTGKADAGHVVVAGGRSDYLGRVGNVIALRSGSVHHSGC